MPSSVLCLALEGHFLHFHSTNSRTFSSVAFKFLCLGSWNAFWDESDASSNRYCLFSPALYFLFHGEEFLCHVTADGFFCMFNYKWFELIYLLQHTDFGILDAVVCFHSFIETNLHLASNNLTWTVSHL